MEYRLALDWQGLNALVGFIETNKSYCAHT